MKRTSIFSMYLGALVGFAGCGEPPAQEVAHQSSPLTLVSQSFRGYVRSDGVHAIVYTGVDGHVHEYAENPFGNGVFTDLQGRSDRNSIPWGYVRSDGINAVMYTDSAAHVHELTKGGDSWIDNDFTALSFIQAPQVGFEPRGGGIELLAYVRTDNRNTIVYRGLHDNHIYEISSNFSSSPPWLVNDLTAFTGAPIVKTGYPMPYIRSDGRNIVVYVATDDHVHELASNFSGFPAWIDSDLFQASGATVAADSGPWGYVRSDGVNAVVFAGTDSKVWELSLRIGSNCGARPWCVTSIAPNATNLRPSAYVRSDGMNAVLYLRFDGALVDLREASLAAGNSSWSDNLLTATTPGFGPPFGHRAPGNRSSVLLLRVNSMNQSVAAELSLPNGGRWQYQEF